MSAPCLSIGLPVYNGELYIEAAIRSLLAQTYTDFELIIADNASTDRTATICRAYAHQDARIRFIENAENIGAARNFNKVFALARGRYFKWCAHDDVLSPNFLARCMAVLEQDPGVVLCYSKANKINEMGELTGTYDYDMAVGSPSLTRRFKDLIMTQHFCISVFGVARRDMLAKTPLIQSYVGSDRNLIAEMALHGRLHEIPEYLFERRDHPGASTNAYAIYNRLKWFDPRRGKKLHFPAWRVGWEYERSVLRAPLSLRQRVALTGLVLRWFVHRRRTLAEDLKAALVRAFPFSLAVARKLRQRNTS